MHVLSKTSYETDGIAFEAYAFCALVQLQRLHSVLL